MFLDGKPENWEGHSIVGKECPGQCGTAAPIYHATPQQAMDFAERVKNIQQIMPEVSADDRERFITGYCPKCWEALFA